MYLLRRKLNLLKAKKVLQSQSDAIQEVKQGRATELHIALINYAHELCFPRKKLLLGITKDHSCEKQQEEIGSNILRDYQ